MQVFLREKRQGTVSSFDVSDFKGKIGVANPQAFDAGKIVAVARSTGVVDPQVQAGCLRQKVGQRTPVGHGDKAAGADAPENFLFNGGKQRMRFGKCDKSMVANLRQIDLGVVFIVQIAGRAQHDIGRLGCDADVFQIKLAHHFQPLGLFQIGHGQKADFILFGGNPFDNCAARIFHIAERNLILAVLVAQAGKGPAGKEQKINGDIEAERLFAVFGDILLNGRHMLENFTAVRNELNTEGSQCNARLGAHKNVLPQLTLQRFNGGAEAGLRQIQTLRSAVDGTSIVYFNSLMDLL